MKISSKRKKINLRSIACKIPLRIVGVLSIVLILMSIGINVVGRNVLTDIVDSGMENMTFVYEEVIRQNIEKELEIVHNIAHNSEVLQLLNNYEDGTTMYYNYFITSIIFDNQKNIDNNKEDILLFDKEGKLLISSEVLEVEGEDILYEEYVSELEDFSHKEYVSKTIATEEAVVSGLEQMEDTGEYVICFTAPIHTETEEFLGVVSTYVYVSSLFEILFQNELYNSENTYMWVYDGTQKIIAHREESLVGTEEENSIIIEALESNIPAYKEDRQNNIGNVKALVLEDTPHQDEAIYMNIGGTDWTLFMGISYDEILGSYIKRLQVNNNGISIAMLIAISLMSIKIVIELVRPIQKLNQLMERTQQLDLKDVEEDILFKKELSKGDEITSLVEGLIDIRKKFREAVGSVAKNTMQLQENMVGVTQGIDLINTSAAKNMSVIEELYGGLQETSAITEEVASTIQSVNGQVDAIEAITTKGNHAIGEIDKKVSSIQSKNEQRIEQVHDKKRAIEERLQDALKKAEVIEEVNVLTDSIKRVTDQVELLALNAAIEAASAGEHGKGFNVIAIEIRKLATESAVTVARIEGVLFEVIDAIENLKESSSEALHLSAQQIDLLAQELISISSEYKNDSTEIQVLMHQISENVKMIDNHSEMMNRGADGIAATSVDNATNAGTITEQSAKMTESIHQITDLITHTKQDSERVSRLIKGFDI